MIPKTMKRAVAIMMLLCFILSPLKASAHEAYFFQVLIDTQNYNYYTAILSDDESTFLGLESEHIEAKFGDFRNLVTNMYTTLPTSESDKALTPNPAKAEVIMPFSFPPIESGAGWFSGVPKNEADQDDANRAYLIKDTLTSGLNDALFVLNKGQLFDDVESFMNTSSALASAINQSQSNSNSVVTVSGTTMTLQVGKRATGNENEPNDEKNGIHNSDYLLIKDGTNEYEYVYRMEKGYVKPTHQSGFDWKNKLYDTRYKSTQDDIPYMTWNAMMYQGFYALVAMGMDAKDSAKIAHVGPLEEAVRWMLESIFNGIRNLLGLYSMNELIYNEGIRGSAVWYHGVMPDAWEKNVMIYHWIFQALAWSLITFSIVKLLISRNLATINPSSRVSLIEGIKDLLITGVVLSFIMPLINLLLVFNSRIVDIFAAVGPDLDQMTGLNEFTGLLAGVILQFFYLIILIWLNFTYIIRSITVAILTVLAPIFVVTLSLGGQWKGLFVNWMKELTSNIFLQSFHAFLIGFLYLSQISSRGIELAVICFAMIPLTEFFRGMIMGQAGSKSAALGVSSLTALGGMATEAAKKKKNTVGASRIQGGASDGGKTAGSNGGVATDGSTKTSSMGGELKTGSSDKIRQNQQNQEMANSQSRTKHQDLRNAQVEKQVPPEIAMKGRDSEEYQRFMGGDMKSDYEARLSDFKDNMQADYGGSKGLKAGLSAIGSGLAVGAGAVGLGTAVGYGMAMGAEDKGAIRDAANMGSFAKGNMGDHKANFTAITGKAFSDAKMGMQLRREGRAINSVTNPTGAPIRATQGAGTMGQALQSGVRSLATKTSVNAGATGGALVPGGIVGMSGNPSGSAMATKRELDVGKASASGTAGSYAPASDLGGQIHYQSMGKGNSEVYRDGQVLSEQGILRAHEDDNGNAVFVYDQNKFGVMQRGEDGQVTEATQDYANLQNYMKTHMFGSQDEKEHMRQSGIESVAMTGDGHVAVVYNQAGKEAMGIKNVRMAGGNMIETKRADQPMATRASVTTPPMPVRPQTPPPQAQRQAGGSGQGARQGQGQRQGQRQQSQRQGQGRTQDQRQGQSRAQGTPGFNSRPNRNQNGSNQ